MKRFLFIQLMLLATVAMMAVPAKRGMWTTLTLEDGTQVRAELRGDELCHYYQAASGETYVPNAAKRYVKADVSKLQEQVAALRAEDNARRMARLERNFGSLPGSLRSANATAVGQKKAALGEFNIMEGEKKGIVILIEFPDLKFLDIHTPEFYKTMLNEGGPAERGYKGSVKQYFSEQSCGKFTVDFDVAYTYEAPEESKYYGGSVSNGTTMSRIRTLFADAIKAAPADIDWTQYDWDGDGEVDQVFFLYAGYGAATIIDEDIRYNYIWPHEYTLATPLTVSGDEKVYTYACGNELLWKEDPEKVTDSGIGTFCHEFSHCLGYPDLYDTCGACETTSMDYWDIMDIGCYAGNCFIPSPFTLFERMAGGWYQPTALEANQEYTMRPVTAEDGGDMYIIENPNNEWEAYFFHGIKNEGWCAGLYNSKGMLAVYIDFDMKAWAYNAVNCLKDKNINDHPRYTYIPADGSYLLQSTSDLRGDLYGVNGNNSFKATWNDGTDCAIQLTDITILEDGTLTFQTVGDKPDNINNAFTEVGNPRMKHGERYNIAGQKVSSNYKGLVIKNGKTIRSAQP